MKEPILYRIVRPIIKILFNFIFKPTYIGLENIPKECKCILVGNHTSNLDCLLLISSTKRTIHFLAKDSLIKGFKKIFFQNMGIIPVNRKIHDKNALNSAIDILNENKVIGIFPEGTINKTKDIFLLPFKFGTVSMAKKTNATIVPFGLTGNYKFRSKNLTIRYGTPFKVGDMSLEEANDKLYKEVEKLMKLNLDISNKNN